MDTYGFIASLVQSLAWPAAVLVLAWLFKQQIGALLGRLRSAKGLGFEGTFDPEQAEAAVNLATAEATASVTATASGLAGASVVRDAETQAAATSQSEDAKLQALLDADPRSAVIEAYRLVELEVRMAMSERGDMLSDRYQGRLLIDSATKADVIPPSTALAIERLRQQRNIASHRETEVTRELAEEYVSLAAQVLYSIRLTRLLT